MKKLFFLIQLTAAVVLFSPVSHADDNEWEHHGHHRGHGWGHHGHHHHYYPRPEVHYYYPQPEVYYYPQPPVRYYSQPPRYSGYDQRSHQGLAGGVIGSVFGYELGSGDPLATGLGAAAGSFFGNGVGGGGW
jgi:hypothetical protein